MIGLPKSSSVMPVARHRERAPAASRPTVVVRDRRAGIVTSLIAVKGLLAVMGWDRKIGTGPEFTRGRQRDPRAAGPGSAPVRYRGRSWRS
ncbi:hypothetical protein GCM10022231_15260 [Gordonia caeni]|uniref:Uncharacterized protein n=1 Tax=Gordonia caeni TaxID=1007097 RepID=A0ABP7NZC4_9ACTN